MTPTRKKALFVIDVQPLTLSTEAKMMIGPIASYIAASAYDAYVEASYYADKDSMFYKQEGFYLPPEEASPTAPEIMTALTAKQAPVFSLVKNSRSCFSDEVDHFLKSNGIEEIHLVGFDINDCVLASAFAALDRGYFTYVLEDLCHHHHAQEQFKFAALTVLREQSMAKVSTSKD